MIAPAPRKPIPVTICAAIRVGSARTTLAAAGQELVEAVRGDDREERRAEPDEQVRAQPGLAVAQLALEADRRRRARPRRTSRQGRSQSLREPIPLTRSAYCLGLRDRDLLDPGLRQLEQLVEANAGEGHLLRGRLHLDQPPVAGHDDVHVDLGGRVLGVVEVEQRHAVDDADRDRGDRPRQRLREPEPVERATRRDVGAADRGAARAAVGLEHVAVELDRALAERLEVDDGAQRAADQPLDLDRPPALLAARRLAVGALARRRRQQRVLGRHPAAARPGEPARHALLHRRRAEHARLALRPEHGAVRLLEEVGDDLERAQLVRPATVRAGHAAASSSATATCSTSPIGSWRKRSPSARKSSGSPVVRNR